MTRYQARERIGWRIPVGEPVGSEVMPLAAGLGERVPHHSVKWKGPCNLGVNIEVRKPNVDS